MNIVNVEAIGKLVKIVFGGVCAVIICDTINEAVHKGMSVSYKSPNDHSINIKAQNEFVEKEDNKTENNKEKTE